MAMLELCRTAARVKVKVEVGADRDPALSVR